MIRTDSKLEYHRTVFYITVEVPAGALGFEEDEKSLDEKFEKELRKYDLGIVYKPTSELHVRQDGYTQFHLADKCWERHYIVEVNEPTGGKSDS